MNLLQPIKEQFPELSYADFYTLAGVVAVEVTGGPTIPFHPGRKVRAWLGIRGEVRVLVVAPECGIREAVML